MSLYGSLKRVYTKITCLEKDCGYIRTVVGFPMGWHICAGCGKKNIKVERKLKK